MRGWSAVLILMLLLSTPPLHLSITASTSELHPGDRFVVTVGIHDTAYPAQTPIKLLVPPELTIAATEILSTTRIYHLQVRADAPPCSAAITAVAEGAAVKTSVRIQSGRRRVALPWVAR